MGSIGATELIIIAVVLVVLFGATRLPATAKGLGQALRVFKKEVRDDDEPTPSDSTADKPAPELTTGGDAAAKTTAADPTTKPAADAAEAPAPKPVEETTAAPVTDVKASNGAKRAEA